MDIRAYCPEDADALSALYACSVTGLGGRRYSPTQVAAWLTLTPSADELRRKAADGRIRLVAVTGCTRLAFADLEPDGHIDLFYAAPEAAGTGVSSALYDRLEQEARRMGLTRLYAEASALSCNFFIRNGFTLLHRRDFQIAGVDVFNYAVEKVL